MNGQFLFDLPLPAGWRLLSVDDIKAPEKHSCTAGPFGSSISSKFFIEEGVPVIRGGNLRDDLTPFVAEGFAFVSPEQAQRYKGQHVRGGDLVFTCWGTLGQVGLIPENGPFPEYIISNKQLKLRSNGQIANPKFLFYYFGSPQMVRHIRSIAIGAAVPGINLGLLKALQVALPPLKVQKEIVRFLSAYDDLIENNTRRIKILEEMAQRIYREWFVNFRFPGHEKVRLVKSGLGPIPAGWEPKRLEDIASVNELSIKMSSAPERIRYIDIASVSTARIEKIESLNFADAPGRARRIVRHGDIIWSTVRPNRRSYALIVNPEQNVIVSTGFAVLTAKTLPFSYLYFAVTTDEFADYLTNHATGSAYPAVTGKEFQQAQLLIPPISLTNRFHEITEPMLSLSWCLHERNANLRTTRDFLLPKLISGEIPVEAAAEAMEQPA
jgi:type I restriction enzyme S subunit